MMDGSSGRFGGTQKVHDLAQEPVGTGEFAGRSTWRGRIEEVRDGVNRFDEAALSRWMEGHVEGFSGPLTVEQFKGGQSNPTYKLVTPSRAYVLRRKPPDRKSTRLNSSHIPLSRMPSSA